MDFASIAAMAFAYHTRIGSQSPAGAFAPPPCSFEMFFRTRAVGGISRPLPMLIFNSPRLVLPQFAVSLSRWLRCHQRGILSTPCAEAHDPRGESETGPGDPRRLA